MPFSGPEARKIQMEVSLVENTESERNLSSHMSRLSNWGKVIEMPQHKHQAHDKKPYEYQAQKGLAQASYDAKQVHNSTVHNQQKVGVQSDYRNRYNMNNIAGYNKSSLELETKHEKDYIPLSQTSTCLNTTGYQPRD